MFNRIKLRKATFEDADYLLALKNDKVMRKFAVVTNSKIRKADHLKWLKDNIDTVSIILYKGERAGMFRVTEDREVSINIDPLMRGQGLGGKVLKLCPKKVWAKIVNGNVPSMRIFLANGFKITGYENDYYILKN